MDSELRRELGFIDTLMIGIGGMIGAAIFIFPGTTGFLAGDAAVLAWVIAGVLMMGIALMYVELASAFPKAGGPVVYPYETITRNIGIRRFFSYLEGVGFFVGWTIAIVVSSLALSSYIDYIIPGSYVYMVPIAIISIILAFAVNFAGIKITGKTNLVLTSFLLAILILFIGKALSTGHPPGIERLTVIRPNGFLASIALAVGAYGAWVGITTAAEEIKNPEKIIPRSVILSIIIVTILYGLIVYAIHSLITPEEFATNENILYSPIGYAATKLTSTFISRFLLPIAAITAIFTTMLVGIMSLGRALYALGLKGLLPRKLSYVYEKTGTPLVALLVTTIISIILAMFPGFFFKFIVVGLVVGTDIPYAINILSFIGLRRIRKEVKPSFRAPGGMALPIVAFVLLAITSINLGYTELKWSIGTLLLIILVYVLHGLLGRRSISSKLK